MLYKIKNNIKSILKHFPLVEKFLWNRYSRKRFKTELALIKGKHKNSNNHPSIIHFSFNKAATTYVSSILRRCSVKNGMVPVGIHEYAFNSNFPYLDHLSAEEMEKYKHIFKATGYLYSTFGGMIEGIPDLEKYKIVFVTRDPRDILVSQYYSTAYSHPLPPKLGDRDGYDKFVSKRNEVVAQTIDDYVLSTSDSVYDIFSRYQTLLIDKNENIHVTTYEKMVSDFENWLAELINYCELELSIEFFQRLLKENEDMKPKKENIYTHIRKGQPGDYSQKLQPKTIKFLNEKFAPILTSFKYNS